MLLYWYAYISINTDLHMMYNISLETVWWVLSNTSSIMWIHSTVHEIIANKTFTVTNSLISWLFVVGFVHSIYVWITIIWGFLAQLILWKLVHYLWKYKLNKVCDTLSLSLNILSLSHNTMVYLSSRVLTIKFHSVTVTSSYSNLEKEIDIRKYLKIPRYK